jgi:hypothetical protein
MTMIYEIRVLIRCQVKANTLMEAIEWAQNHNVWDMLDQTEAFVDNATIHDPKTGSLLAEE